MAAEDPKHLVDSLVAATLVAASLAVLFSLWQAEVAENLAIEPSDTQIITDFFTA